VQLEYCSHCGTRLRSAAPCTCAQCGTEFWANPKPCAGALVTRDGHLLLVRRAFEPWAGCWDIPGGFCEAGEHPEQTAVRELREETGLDVVLDRLLGMWMDAYDEHDPPETTLNIYFMARPARPGVEPQRSDEVTDAAWFGPDDLPSDLAFPRHAVAVLERWRAAIDGSAEPGAGGARLLDGPG
jgi:ADP-ribose pyrophosphatase YjhB (NUDIX family)